MSKPAKSAVVLPEPFLPYHAAYAVTPHNLAWITVSPVRETCAAIHFESPTRHYPAFITLVGWN